MTTNIHIKYDILSVILYGSLLDRVLFFDRVIWLPPTPTYRGVAFFVSVYK